MANETLNESPKAIRKVIRENCVPIQPVRLLFHLIFSLNTDQIFSVFSATKHSAGSSAMLHCKPVSYLRPIMSSAASSQLVLCGNQD